jgi:dTDP-4-dehydrorhamnose reductase
VPQKSRLLVTGGSGYLGQQLVCDALADWDVTATYFSHRPAMPGCRWVKLDVCDGRQVARLLERVAPQVVIHTAAHRSGADLQRVNVAGTRRVALAALQIGARLIHLSTDVVFDGRKGGYVESDPPSPVNAYGRSKADAETLLAEQMPRATVVRTSLIYGFASLDHHTRWMLESLRQGRPVQLFADERRCPIWVETLAAALLELATLDYAGVLHVAGGQALNRYEFGARLLGFRCVEPSGVTAALATASGLARPLDCTLDVTRAKALLRTPLPGVDEVIARQSIQA